MKRRRRVFDGDFRAKVALAAVKGDKTLSELAGQYEVHSTQVATWRKELIERAAELFEDGSAVSGADLTERPGLMEEREEKSNRVLSPETW